MAEQATPSDGAAKFNTEVPAGYVPGRGRGALGFSQAPPDHVPRGRSNEESSGAGPSLERGPARKAPSAHFALGDEDKDTGVHFGKSGQYEERGLSLSRKEAGYEVEAFNLEAERATGRFDDDFNYIPKRRRAKGEEPTEDEDEGADPWLQSMDDLKESEEKVAKRVRAARIAEEKLELALAEDEAIDVDALTAGCVALMLPGETVLRALRRLGGGGASRGKGPSASVAASGAPPADKPKFDELTDAASRLMSAGKVGIYSETREALAGADDAAPRRGGAFPQSNGAAANSGGSGGSGAFPPAPSEFAFDSEGGSGCYFSASGFCFDPRTQFYWDPRANPPLYFYYDSAASLYVQYETVAGAPAAA
ncbi:hypothetical protein T492DRAFT_911508 [Pavlovales sp. CCMP2436]|nr:hypothetical protein T492DRAFT_911508 [Pavlovales sp. CCMP2436]|mmetsp:Transcript_12679/g.32103  ORF Transcript_12679/g.32103 Transcript_12679/m.32103 type:complete len:366 (+) Transcript_12679:115-1212(+)